MNNILVTYLLTALMGDGNSANGCVRGRGHAWMKGAAPLTPATFFVAQTLYTLWNAVNDPLFGWLSDRADCCAGSTWVAKSPRSALLKRAGAIRWGGLAWAAAFALAWFPPTPPNYVLALKAGAAWSGSHYFIVIALYDAALSFVEVNHTALLAEMVDARGLRAEAVRARANAASAMGAALGAVSSLPAHFAWAKDCDSDGDSGASWPGPFRTFCVCLAVFAAAVFVAAASGLEAAAHASAPATAAPNSVGDADADIARRPPGSPRWRESHREKESVWGERGEPRGDGDDGDASDGDGLPLTAPTADADADSLSPSFFSFVYKASQLPALRTYTVVASVQAFDCALGKGFFATFLAVFCLAAAGGGSSSLSDDALRLHGMHASPLPWLTALFPRPTGAAALPPPPTASSAPPSLVSDATLALLVAASFVLPHVCTVLMAPLVAARGSAEVIGVVFRARLALALAAAAVTAAIFFAPGATLAVTGSQRTTAVILYAVLGYQLASRVTSEVVCRAMPLAKAQLVDAAARAARGPYVTPAALVGAADFFPKVLGSLAPLAGFALLGVAQSEGGGLGTPWGVWGGLIVIPGFVAAVQVTSWSLVRTRKWT
jgi:hypothetical protein